MTTTPPETPIANSLSLVSSFYDSNGETQNPQNSGRRKEYEEYINNLRREYNLLKERNEVLEKENELLKENSKDSEEKISSIEVENGYIDLGITKVNGKFKVVFNNNLDI
ncbi:8813_t:CDS:2 [Cetraspora pellucida]|uniref:8813_t:CDS:1 n=1 Tax=Cetraspora pellucida TaxID=1433469 RepID=A0A9N8VG51_9GLOM|nr:8813_t:CDS:2 [Cetraspora pellucida]